MLMAFGDLQQSVPPRHVAERALLLSRRRSVTLYYRIGLAAATVATILVMFLWRLASAPLPATSVSETFRLQCLSPEQAAELIRPHIQTTGRVSFRASSPVGIITVEASPEEMEAARSLLGRYDSPTESQCAVQVTVPQVP
jgi:type II secretory pathway component GspD/PulD (secretin)